MVVLNQNFWICGSKVGVFTYTLTVFTWTAIFYLFIRNTFKLNFIISSLTTKDFYILVDIKQYTLIEMG